MMGRLAEIFVALLLKFILSTVLFPFGLLRLWIKEQTKKSFKKIIQENSFPHIALQGRIFMIDLVAAAGALGLTLILITAVSVMIWDGIKALPRYRLTNLKSIGALRFHKPE